MNTQRGLFENVTQRIAFRFALRLAAPLSYCVGFAAATGTPNVPSTLPNRDSPQWRN
jgi:hypothetical protein